MAELTKKDVREIVREETVSQFVELRDRIDDAQATLGEKTDHVASVLNGKVDAVLTKMDGFLKGLEDEKHERLFGDAQLERRVERLEAQKDT